MRTPRIAFVALATAIGLAALAPQGGPEIGKPAPTFTLPDSYGAIHDLAQYRGRWVVLEWLDYLCPYVSKHYRTDNIPSQQRKWTGRGAAWLSIVSTAPGKPGYHGPDELNAVSREHRNAATAVLLDPDGTVGRLYEARTTPHMFVIDPEGRLRYMGGIDDIPTSRDEDLERATQLVDRALEEATAGRPVSQPVSRPYGCGVKYR